MAPQPPRRKSPQRLSALFSGPVTADAATGNSGDAAAIEAAATTLALGDGAIAQSLPLDCIDLSPSQPRRHFDAEALARLTASVRQHGVLEPILVRPRSRDRYELVAGERRYRAAQAAQLTTIPAISRPLADLEVVQIALVENLLREDLNPVEETEGILQLLALRLETTPTAAATLLQRMDADRRRGSDNVMGQAEAMTAIATFEALGRMGWRSFVANRLPLLNLAPDVLDALRQGKLAYTKAQAIARVADPEVRRRLLTWTIEQQPPLTALRQAIARSQPPTPGSDLDPDRDPQSSNPDPDAGPEADLGELALRDRWRAIVERAAAASDLWRDPQRRAALAPLLTDLETLLTPPPTPRRRTRKRPAAPPDAP